MVAPVLIRPRSNGLDMRSSPTSIRAEAFSPDGTLLATGDDQGTVRLWEVATGRAYAVPLTGHQGKVLALAFSPDGRTLYSTGDHRTVMATDIAPANNIASLCKSSDGGLTKQEWKSYLPSVGYRTICP